MELGRGTPVQPPYRDSSKGKVPLTWTWDPKCHNQVSSSVQGCASSRYNNRVREQGKVSWGKRESRLWWALGATPRRLTPAAPVEL